LIYLWTNVSRPRELH